MNKKNIFISLLVLGFFGLLYAFLGSKPVMVSDSRLRVEEPPLLPPSARSQGHIIPKDTTQFAPVLSEDLESRLVVIERSSPPAQLVLAEETEKRLIVEVIEPADEVVAELEYSSRELSSDTLTTDVAVISEPESFIDLNLVETTPVEITLIEGDELILDDVNEELDQYQISVENKTAEPEVVVDDVTTQTTNSYVDSKPIVIPDADEELMSGTDKVSLEYQAGMAKLLKIKQQMVDADVENERLTHKFSLVVDQNRELAILIRDIDVKIKTLTLPN